MNLAEMSNGPDWILWVVFTILTVISVILISGHGSGLIAGYNTAGKTEKAKYDGKKLCRITGIGLAVVCGLILVMGLCENVLPASFAYFAAGIILIDCLAVIIAGGIICKK